MKDTVRYPLVLLLVCTAAGLALSVTFALTYDTIQRKDDQKRAKALVSAFMNVEVPEGVTWENFEEKKIGKKAVYTGYADAKKTSLLGYAAEGEAPGYSSTLQVMVGVAPLGKGQYRILGVKVTAQQETPGLGTRVADVYTQDTLWTAIGSMFEAEKREHRAPPTPYEKEAAGKLGVKPEAFPLRPPFQAQFAGKIVTLREGKAGGLQFTGDWSKVKEGEFADDDHAVAAMTGATISSKGMATAIYDAIIFIDRECRKTPKE